MGERRSAIPSPTAGLSPSQHRALTRLYELQGVRENGQYQGGEWLDILQRETGLTDDELRLLEWYGNVVRRGAGGRWGVEIAPRGVFLLDAARMHVFLCSIATAQPQSEQAGWMVATARDGLRWGPNDPQGADRG